MKTLVLFLSIYLLIPLSFLSQEIPNGGFESWSITNGWTEEPDGWETPNNQLIETTVKDLDAYVGEFAMRVNPYNIGVGEYGWGSVDLPIEFIPPCLDFYAKWDKTSTAAVGVDITFFNGKIPVYTAYWFAEVNQSEWSLIQIPLDQIEPVMDHVVITVYVSIGDFAAGEGWISVDEMSFGNPNDLEEQEDFSLGLFPNPTSNVLSVRAEVQPLNYSIINSSGRLVDQGSFKSEIDVSQLPVANYTLQLRMKDGSLVEKRFQVER